MKESNERTKGVKIKRIWFLDSFSNVDLSNCDVIYIYGYKEKLEKYKCTLQHTIYLDLLKSEEELFNSIKKNVRYEINRSYKENVNAKIFNSEELKNNPIELSTFEKKYNQMYFEKGLNTRLNINTVKSYIDNNMFILTKSIYENKELSYHAYVVDNKSARLLYSCSNFRSNNKDEKNLIARANKFLHWEDIKYFKNNDFKIYDFGGITSIEKPNGIDQFKLSFNGTEERYYNIIIPITLKGKICFLAKRILNK